MSSQSPGVVLSLNYSSLPPLACGASSFSATRSNSSILTVCKKPLSCSNRTKQLHHSYSFSFFSLRDSPQCSVEASRSFQLSLSLSSSLALWKSLLNTFNRNDLPLLSAQNPYPVLAGISSWMVVPFLFSGFDGTLQGSAEASSTFTFFSLSSSLVFWTSLLAMLKQNGSPITVCKKTQSCTSRNQQLDGSALLVFSGLRRALQSSAKTLSCSLGPSLLSFLASWTSLVIGAKSTAAPLSVCNKSLSCSSRTQQLLGCVFSFFISFHVVYLGSKVWTLC